MNCSFFSKPAGRHKGIALFVAMLISMSLAVIALASMSRLSEATHTTGKNLQDRRLLSYAQSAGHIVAGEIQQFIDAEITAAEVYTIHGMGGEGEFKYYPRDIFINPDISGTPTMFGYRAVARLFAGPGDSPPVYATGETVPDNGICYNIIIDVREVMFLPSGNITSDENSKTVMSKYHLGKMKTVGMISCFKRGLI
ncbi:MAG: hypothetical protein ACOX2F_05415 [bacterium]